MSLDCLENTVLDTACCKHLKLYIWVKRELRELSIFLFIPIRVTETAKEKSVFVHTIRLPRKIDLHSTCCKQVKLYVWVKSYENIDLCFTPLICLENTVLHFTCCQDLRLSIWVKLCEKCPLSRDTSKLPWKHSLWFHMLLRPNTIHLSKIASEVSIFVHTSRMPR